MKDIRKTPRKVGKTHILWKDEKGHKKVGPIAEMTCEQGAHGSPDTYHLRESIVTKNTFDQVIKLLDEEDNP